MLEASSPVVIAGGGLTGLTIAVFLGWHGLPHVLVERQGDDPPGARPIALNPRTVEVFRSIGLEAALRQAAVSPQAFSNVNCPWPNAGQRLPWLAPSEAQWPERAQDTLSPCPGILSTQGAVAALLRARAQALGSRLQFGARLVAFEPEAEGIRALLEHPITGRQESLRAQYLVVAADSRDEHGQQGGAPAFIGRFQSGRVCNVGRVARTLMIPAVFALNLDLQDAHNLAWKLAYVATRQAGPALLETYEAEQRPAAFVPMLGPLGYRSGAVLPDARDEQAEPPMDLWASGGRPGTRVPHVVLQRNGERLSTLDLCGGDFVLLTGADGQAWCEAAERVTDRLGTDLEAYRIGQGGDLSTQDERWPAAFGLTESGALLVRPDGYVGWRSQAALPDPERVLREMLARLLCRGNIGSARP